MELPEFRLEAVYPRFVQKTFQGIRPSKTQKTTQLPTECPGDRATNVSRS